MVRNAYPTEILLLLCWELRVYDYNPCLWQSTLEIDVPALSEHISETWKNKDNDRSYLSILRESK